MSIKACDKCKEFKGVEYFYKSKINTDGYANSCKVCYSKRCKKRRDRLKDCPIFKKSGRDAGIKHKYKISGDEYDEYLSKPCGICGETSEVLDHCHDTNKVRGGLCQACNKLLGCAKDNINNLKGAILWLKKYPKH